MPKLGEQISFITVERIGVVALVVILFDGGLDIGWRRFRGRRPDPVARPDRTFASAGLIAVAAHFVFDLPGSRAA